MKKTANLLVTAYLLLLFVAYPFYMKEGYVEIGRAKYSFWIRISLSTAAVLLLFFVIRLIRELKEKSLQLQATDISILVFAGTHCSGQKAGIWALRSMVYCACCI